MTRNIEKLQQICADCSDLGVKHRIRMCFRFEGPLKLGAEKGPGSAIDGVLQFFDFPQNSIHHTASCKSVSTGLEQVDISLYIIQFVQ